MKKILIQSTSVTLFVFVLMGCVLIITDLKIFSAFDTIGQAFQDTQLTDYAFNRLREDPTVDQRIVLVNIGQLSRRDIAREIQIINQYKPRVIAFDGFFNCEGGLRDTINCPALLDPLGNLILANTIQEAGNVILGEKLMQTDSLAQFDSNISDSLEISDPMFDEHSKRGFVTLPTDATYQEDVKQCRSVWPQVMVRGNRELAFSVQVAMQYDSVKAKKFLARDNEEEILNFRGNIQVLRFRVNSLKNESTGSTNFATMFYVVDYTDLFEGAVLPELFKDNIVLLGYLGDYLGDSAWEDKFYTPLNKKLGGRANPDMFGLVVHANAVAMILNEDYVNELSEWQKYLIAIVTCLLTVMLFSVIDAKLPIWYDALSVLIQLTQIAILMLIVVYVFARTNLKLDLSLTFAVTALVGPGYDIFKPIQKQLQAWLTKRRERVLNS